MASHIVNGKPEDIDQGHLPRNGSLAAGLPNGRMMEASSGSPREETRRNSHLPMGRGSEERDEAGGVCSNDTRYNSDISSPRGRQPSGEEEMITETEELFKNKVVLTASVVIMPKAWNALMGNKNLKKCLPTDVRLQQSFTRENEREGVEVIGCWKSVDVVTSLAAEAWMATQSRRQLREKTREQQEIQCDPELHGEKQQTSQKRNPQNAAHRAVRTATAPAGPGRGEMAREKKDPELMTDHRDNGMHTDKSATSSAGLGRGEITKEQSNPELRQERTGRTDRGDNGNVTDIDIASSDDPRDTGETSKERRPEWDPYRTGKEHITRSQQNAGSRTVTKEKLADEEMSSENESPDSAPERTSRNPAVGAYSRKQVGSDRRKYRTFSKLECEMGKVFFTENLILKVYEGDITSLSGVDCIVNSTDQHLKHGGGAALAIKRAAGPDFEKECGKCKALEVGKCVSTGAGNLKYKKVFHVTLPVWKSFDESGCLKALQKSLEAALLKARTEKMNCMALSGIGTGVQHYPKDKWANAVVETIMKYSKAKKPPEEIHFVDTNTELLRLLKIGLSKAFPSSTKEMLPPLESSSQGLPHGASSQRVSSKGTLAEMKPTGQESRLTAEKESDIGLPAVFDITSSCKLVVDKKNLVNFHGDAIGVTDDTNMFGLGPLSEAIASAAGQSYVSEKWNKWNATVGQIVVTKAGKLHCEHILHGIISRNYIEKLNFSSLVQNMLAEASHLKVKTLAVPALCTGFSGLMGKEGCDLLVTEICKFVKKDPRCTLKEIYILDVDPKKVEQLCLSVSKLESERWVFRTKPSALMTSQLESPSALGAAKSSSADKTSPAQSFTMPATQTCRITVQNKSLTDFSGDAIMITITGLFPLAGMHSRMSERISAVAGEEYEKERRKMRDKYLQPKDVIETKAGNLTCRCILHAVQDRFIGKAELKASVKGVLTQASTMKLRRVAFPAMWAETGYSVYSSLEWLELFLKEICKFMQNHPHSSVEEIHILDTDDDRVQEINRILRKQLSAEMLMEPGRMDQVTDTYAYSAENGARQKQAVLQGDQISGAYTVCYICNNRHRNPIHTCDCGRQICIRCKTNLHNCPFDQHNKMATKATVPAAVAMPGEKSQSEPSCVICLSTIKRPEKLPCGHVFCKGCIQQCFEKGYKLCPVCKAVCGVVIGDQPEGKMAFYKTHTSCEGYEGFGSIVINYIIPDGIQKDCHPHPEKPYKGLCRTGYLPNNREGLKVLKLLQQAFDQRLIFTIGRSVTTGKDDVVTWNDIHHKTAQHGGPEKFGYPDPGYLSRVQEELQAKGIGGSSHEGSPV